MKDTDEFPMKRYNVVKSGWVPSIGASVSMDLECVTLLVGMCSPTWRLSEPSVLGILWRLHHVGVIDHNSIFRPSPFEENGRQD